MSASSVCLLLMTAVSRHTMCWLVRHGQTDWSRAGRYLSRTDLALTSFGLLQARAVGYRLRRLPLSAIMYADLRYAAEMARVIAEMNVRSPDVIAAPAWRDVDQGQWEGLTYHDVLSRYPAEARARFANPWAVAPPGGETYAAASARILGAWCNLQRQHDGGRIVVVTHALPIQLIVRDVLGISHGKYWQLRIDLGGISCIDLYPGAAIMRVVNEVPSARQVGNG
jgi:2,3-bisphosphoglycerate-dependent phosphoglycerate mutase/probable phosphoglycerate mutase